MPVVFRLYHRLEDASLVLLLTGLLGMSILQIVFRNTGINGFVWFDTATRIMVLWMALFGAMRAARLQNHIAIDLIGHYANENSQRIIHFIASVASGIICAISAYYSYLFVVSEYEYPASAFLNVPSWACEAIIPYSFLVIGLRLFYHSLQLPKLAEENIEEHLI